MIPTRDSRYKIIAMYIKYNCYKRNIQDFKKSSIIFHETQGAPSFSYLINITFSLKFEVNPGIITENPWF